MRLKCPNVECTFEETLPDQEEVMLRLCPVCGYQGTWVPWLSFRTMVNGVMFSETDARPSFNFALRTESNHFNWLLGLPWAVPSMKVNQFFGAPLTYAQYLTLHEKRLGVEFDGPVWVEDPKGQRILEGTILRNGPLTDPDFIR